MSKPKWERKFLGEIILGSSDRRLTEEEKEKGRFENKHLRAYMQGKSHFQWGWINVKHPLTGGDMKVPNMVEVKQELNKL